MRYKLQYKPKLEFVFTIVFILISVMEIYGVFHQNKVLEFVCKPLIMVSLVSLYMVSVKNPSFLYVSAVFFSFWGDVLLLFPERYFMLGLISFLFTHLIYIRIILRYIQKISLITYATYSLPFLLYFSGIIFLVKDNLNTLLIPVVIYGIIISVFGTLALIHYNKNKDRASNWLLIGAVFFIISDSLIAINKFYIMHINLGAFVMITYVVAQYLICKAVVAKS